MSAKIFICFIFAVHGLCMISSAYAGDEPMIQINLKNKSTGLYESRTQPLLVYDATEYAAEDIGYIEYPEMIADTDNIIIHNLARGFYLRIAYDIYENNQRVYGPIIESTHEDCFVNGKKEIQLDSIFYTYTIRTTFTEPQPYYGTCIIDFIYEVPGDPPYQMSVNIINLTDQSLSLDQNAGTLYRGLISLYYKTNCTAMGFTNCSQAASLDVLPGKNSPWFNFVAGTDNLLGSQLTYAIDDPTLDDFHQVKVLVQNGEEVLDRCQAYIDPPTMGPVKYFAQAMRVSDLDCQVQVTREVIGKK